MAYRDRKMMKWQGLVLSEHNEDISYHNRNKTKPVLLDEQSVELFNEMLLLSYQHKSLISIHHSNPSDEFDLEKQDTGYVYKYDVLHKGIILKHQSDTQSFINFDSIRQITVVDDYAI